MPATAPNQPSHERVTHTPPDRKTSRIRPFTRFPAALAAVAHLRLQACARSVLALLVALADPQGVSWISPREITRRLPRSGKVVSYSLPQVLRALRQLRDAGLLVWDVVPAMGRFPRRLEGRTVARNGVYTVSGGRVWRVLVDELKRREILRSNGDGTVLARAIMHDRGTPIIGDRPSDRSPSEILKMDPAPEAGASTASPGVVTAIERSQAPALPPMPARALPPPRATAHAPRPPEKGASETPSAPVAALASPRGPCPSSEREPLQGGGRVNRQAPGEPPAAVTAQRMAADLEALFSPRRLSPMTAERQNRPKGPDR